MTKGDSHSESRMRRPTQSDVARLANVSRATVSIVLRGLDDGRIPISSDTRRRVLDAARVLGYVPNLAAQALAGGSNRLIGVFSYEPIFPIETDGSYYQYVLGVERQASIEDYNLLLFTRRGRGEKPSVYRNGTNTLSLVDGAILLGSAPDRDELRRIADEGRPFVYIGRREVEGRRIDWVSSDRRQAGYIAPRHLAELGHSRIGFVAPDPLELETHIDQFDGCRKAADEIPGVTITRIALGLLRRGGDLVERVRDARLTALICAEFPMMVKCLTALKAHVEVPRDLSVLSLTDWLVDESFPGPKPTMIRVHRERVGRAAVKLLVRKLNGEVTGPQQINIPCTLSIGDTTGPAP